MINAQTRKYNYYTYGDKDSYAQAVLSKEPVGEVKLSISLISQTTTQNINYKDSSYIGLTLNRSIDDTWVIDYNGEKLKVNYVNKEGRFTLVYMTSL